MWDAHALGHYGLFCRELRDILVYAGSNKVFFGTDNPLFNTVEATRNWVRLLKELPVKAPKGITCTEEEIAAVLGGNAATVLGLG
jgi:predicted TIM-barrel fold metal-dependent hydrolase